MYPASREQFQNFLGVQWPNSFYLTYYKVDPQQHDEQLIAVSVCDRFDNGYSAVYTFFDPAEEQRSLGVYAVLNQIARAQLKESALLVSRLLDKGKPENGIQSGIPAFARSD